MIIFEAILTNFEVSFIFWGSSKKFERAQNRISKIESANLACLSW
jgi:hypothetical protein